MIGAALLSATLIGVWRVASHLGVWSRPTMILVCLSPAFATSLMLIGHYDIFIIAGSLVVVCSRRPVLIATGATIAVLGNPEQVLVSAICLVIVAYALDRDRWRTPSLIFVAAGIVGFLVTQVWLHISGATGSRLSETSLSRRTRLRPRKILMGSCSHSPTNSTSTTYHSGLLTLPDPLKLV